MGKRKLAATISGYDHSSEKSCYSSEGITAHLRGWDDGIRVDMRLGDNDVPFWVVYRTGGSNSSGSKQLLCTITSDGEVV